MKVVYPAIWLKDENNIVIYIPDLEAWTFGENLTDAIHMARDRIAMDVAIREEKGEDIPAPSSYAGIRSKVSGAESSYDLTSGEITLVDADSTRYLKRKAPKMAKKNCTIPAYLKDEAERAGINFSQVLQEALAAKLAR